MAQDNLALDLQHSNLSHHRSSYQSIFIDAASFEQFPFTVVTAALRQGMNQTDLQKSGTALGQDQERCRGFQLFLCISKKVPRVLGFCVRLGRRAQVTGSSLSSCFRVPGYSPESRERRAESSWVSTPSAGHFYHCTLMPED